jgi:mono/diheme cytochrome c family protein
MKMTFRTVFVGGVIIFFAVVTAVVFIPSFVWDPPQTSVAHPYTPEEERGRELFYSNGCNYCHTQYVREGDTAMGAVSQGGDYAFDDPMILGSERTGPDLSYVGRKRSQTWEIEHLRDPRTLSPLSIMPSFGFLPEDDLKAITAYLFELGDRVAQERMILPPGPYVNFSDPIRYPLITPAPVGQPQGWPSWLAAGLQEGKELYVSDCLTCHGGSGNGLGSYGGTLAVTPANFKQEPFQGMPDDQWFWHVSEGVPGTVMPPWKASLTEAQRWSVIRYIQQVFAQPMMRDPDEGDPSGTYANQMNPLPLTVEVLDDGKRIFTRECLICHGPAGTGDGPYREGLEPPPPDFSDGKYGTLQNPSYTDADYFWRISEGLPWSAMPAWKLQYSDDDRWKLVHYIRATFTQTEARPPQPAVGQEFQFPDIFKSQTMPGSASYERGKKTFLEYCADCHGLAGDGKGWDGQYLNPKPFDFRQLKGTPMDAAAQGMFLAKVTFGIKDTAMPSWGEFLPEDQRWDVIKFITDSFVAGKPVTSSPSATSQVAANMVTLSKKDWLAAGHVISTTHGADLYATYCATCHGDKGQGHGSGTLGNASSAPAPFPANMGESYIFWRIWDGVPDSVMPPFHWLLPEADLWDITSYLEGLASTAGGGGN